MLAVLEAKTILPFLLRTVINKRRCMIRLYTDAVAYSFGSAGGLVDVTFSEQSHLNTRRDRLVVGFRTAPDADVAAVKSRLLVRVVSATSNDFVQLALVSQLLQRHLNDRAFHRKTHLNATEGCRHMRSHNVTCHLTWVKAPSHNPSQTCR